MSSVSFLTYAHFSMFILSFFATGVWLHLLTETVMVKEKESHLTCMLHTHTHTQSNTPIRNSFLCAICSVEWVEMIHIDMAWQWRASPFQGRDEELPVKAPSVRFRSWNAEDNCPGNGSPAPAENACTELTLLISLPAEIKLSSSGLLLVQPFPQCCSSFTTGSQVFQTVTQFCSQIPLFSSALSLSVSLSHTYTPNDD